MARATVGSRESVYLPSFRGAWVAALQLDRHLNYSVWREGVQDRNWNRDYVPEQGREVIKVLEIWVSVASADLQQSGVNEWLVVQEWLNVCHM